MFDVIKNMVYDVFNSSAGLIRKQSHKFSGLNPNMPAHGELSRLLFFRLLLTLSGLNRLGDINRQVEANNRANNTSMRLVDRYHNITMHMGERVHHCNRIEQPTMWNVVDYINGIKG